MNRRLEAYQLLCSRFGFLSETLRLSNEELRQSANYLRRCYPDDLDETLSSEVIQFVAMMRDILPSADNNRKESLELKLFKILHEYYLVDCFPNVDIAFRIYLCMFVTNCTGERSFSKLKLILNYLRNCVMSTTENLKMAVRRREQN